MDGLLFGILSLHSSSCHSVHGELFSPILFSLLSQCVTIVSICHSGFCVVFQYNSIQAQPSKLWALYGSFNHLKLYTQGETKVGPTYQVGID